MAPERTRSTAQAQAEGLRVFVAGVPWHIHEDTLRRDFEECGVVEDLFLMKDHEGYSRGRCFITFRDKDAVEAALAFDSTEYAGRKIFVKIAEAKKNQQEPEQKKQEKSGKPDKASGGASGGGAAAKEFPDEKPAGCKSVCLKNIGEATEEDVRELLKECTTIQSVRVVYDRVTGAPRGVAFVDFREEADVDIAMKKNGKDLCGNEVRMGYEAPRERPRPEGCMQVALKKLPPFANETDVKRMFKGLKSLSAVRVIRDRAGKCTGLAFAEFTKPEDVEAAVQRDGMKVKDSIIFICYETKAKKTREGTDDKKEKETQESAGEGSAKVKKKAMKKAKKSQAADDDGEEAKEEAEEAEKAEEAQEEAEEPKAEVKQKGTKKKLKTKRKREAEKEAEPEEPKKEEEKDATEPEVEQTEKAPKKKRKLKKKREPKGQAEKEGEEDDDDE